MQEIPEITPDAARAEIDAMPLDGALLSILQDPAHPGHKAATEHRRSLYAVAYPAEPTAGMSGGVETAENPVRIDPAGRSFFEAPSSPKEYRFDATPPELRHDAALEQKVRGWFHKAGVPPWLARNFVNEWNRRAGSPTGSDRSEQDAATAEAALRRRWGADYDAKIDKANGVLRAIGNEEIFDLLNRSGLANDEYLIRQLAALAESRDGT